MPWSARVVTMDASFRVFDPGAVYIDAGGIAAVGPAGAPAPPIFTGITPVRTGGTIYPGLMTSTTTCPTTSCRAGTSRGSSESRAMEPDS